MRVLSRSTLLFLLLFLVACGPSRRGGGGGGGGGGGFDDDDSAADDDDAAPSAGTIAITSAPVTATLPALLVRSTNEFGTSLTLLGGTSDCAGYTAVAEASWSLYEEYSDENISLEDYTNGSAQGTADFFGLGAWMVTVLIESGDVDEGMGWDAGDFGPLSVLVGTADDEWNDRLGSIDTGFVTTGGFSGSIDSGWPPPFEGTVEGTAIWEGGDFDGAEVSIELEATASLCDIDLR